MRSLFALCLIACSASSSIGPAPDTRAAPLPVSFALLGQPCDRADEKVSYRCGKGGVIAQVTVSYASIPPGAARFEMVPSEATRVTPWEPQLATQVAIDGPYVWTSFNCAMCRMLLYGATATDLRVVSDDDLVTLQSTAGLPKSPLLHTSAEWQRAIAATRRWKPAPRG